MDRRGRRKRMIGGRSFYYHYYWIALISIPSAYLLQERGLAAFHSILAGQRAAGGIITRGAGSSRDRF